MAVQIGRTVYESRERFGLGGRAVRTWDLCNGRGDRSALFQYEDGTFKRVTMSNEYRLKAGDVAFIAA